MTTLVKSLKRLYEAGRLTKEQIGERYLKGSISESEYEEIIGVPYEFEEPDTVPEPEEGI